MKNIRMLRVVPMMLLSIGLLYRVAAAQNTPAMPHKAKPVVETKIDALLLVQMLSKDVGNIKMQMMMRAKITQGGEGNVVEALLDKQQAQLGELSAKYKKEAHLVTKEQINKDFLDFFRTGTELRKALMALRPAQGVSAQEYSPDPSQCANHCYETCGYNSLGEKVCWYRCYYCCGNGGC